MKSHMSRTTARSPPRSRIRIGNSSIGPFTKRKASVQSASSRTKRRLRNSTRHSPRPARSATAPRFGNRQRDDRGDRRERRGGRQQQPEPRLGDAVRRGDESMRSLVGVERRREHEHRRGEADGAEGAHPAERIRVILERRQADREQHRDDRPRERREESRRCDDRSESLRAPDREEAERHAERDRDQRARAQSAAIGERAPDRLRQDADRRHHREDHADLRAVELRVLAQVERQVRQREAEGRHAERPVRRERQRAPRERRRVGRHYLPWKAGLRFSRKARTPSR